ncbi:hypothetical protein, partial [Rhodosalinus sediminis]|uniref:hypothetical protein n=1 Tax=Rhodosalinus sediminis TaxID=1940533 RepID=UPI0023555881
MVTTTNWRYPGGNAFAGGFNTEGWFSPQNIEGDTTSAASSDLFALDSSGHLIGNAFGFALPSDAVVTRVEVDADYWAASGSPSVSGGAVFDNTTTVGNDVLVGAPGMPSAQGTWTRVIDATPDDIGYGLPVELVNSAAFGVGLTFSGGTKGGDVRFARIRVRLTYEIDTGPSLTADPLTTAAPTTASPALGQAHALTSPALATAAPTLGLPAFALADVLTAQGITAGTPALGLPALGEISVLTAAPLATGAPATGTPALGQEAALGALPTQAGAPTLGLPALGQDHALAAEAIASGAPETGASALGQTHALSPLALATGAPDTGTPTLILPDMLAPLPATAGTPETGTPALGQDHALDAPARATAAPE